MSGISTGTGIFSGIDTSSIIQQLLAIEARPRDQAMQRVQQLQFQQAAFLDINSRVNALLTSAKNFRLNNTFKTKTANSSDTNVLTATAGITAAAGTYSFIVDRLVSSQQMLSRGFASKDVTAVGATSMTFEPTQARLDRDVSLSELNDHQGLDRGKISITDSTGRNTIVDLSRATSVSDVLDAINNNGVVGVAATVLDGKFIVTDTAGGAGTMTVANTAGYTTATSLGIAGSATGGTITGTQVYGLNSNTAIGSLNDGNGVTIRNVVGTDVWSFGVNVQTGNFAGLVKVNIGDVYESQVPAGGGAAQLVKVKGAATTAGEIVQRINDAFAAAGAGDFSASLDHDNNRIVIRDVNGTSTFAVVENGSTTAADLGFSTTPVVGTLNGSRILAGMNTTLARSLNGGQGISGDGAIQFTLHDGSSFTANVSTGATLADIISQIETASVSSGSKRVSVSLDSRGTGLAVTDLTSGGSNLIIRGTNGADTAASLGIATDVAGTSDASVKSGNLQRQYVAKATLLSSLNAGKGVGTGTIRITDSDGMVSTITVGDSIRSVSDLLALLNSRGLRINAAVNSHGDGIVITEDTTGRPAGANKIKIEDVSGSVAKGLNLAGTASGTGASNKIDGSYEKTVTFGAADTLQQVTDKINAAGVGMTASIIQDGNSVSPYRLSLTSARTGEVGRMIVDTGSLDLGFSTLDAGRDARVFFGAADPARAIAITSSSNTVDNAVAGVKIDLKSISATPVTLSVASDTDSVQSAVGVFVQTFNTMMDRIGFQSRYDQASDTKGPLLGDSTLLDLRSAMLNMVAQPAKGVTGRYTRLADVGITVGQNGSLTFNQDTFRRALADDPQAVEDMFTARVTADDSVIEISPGITARNPNAGNTFSKLGIFGQFEQISNRYVDAVSGILTSASKGIDDQIKLQQDRITTFNERLASRQTYLQNQFAAMESAIANLQTQQKALGSLGG